MLPPKKGKHIDVGNGFGWITLVGRLGHPDVELALEPNANPAGKTFQSALRRAVQATFTERC